MERERKYPEALHYLKIFLDGTKDSPLASAFGASRGHFYIRYVVDLAHANRPTDCLKACETALSEENIQGESRLFLQNKCLALCVPPRRWKKPVFPPLHSAPVIQLELGDLDRRKMGGKSLEDRVLDYLLGEEMAVNDEGEDDQRVEVIQWKGSHCENGVYLTLFALLCWDVIFYNDPRESNDGSSNSNSFVTAFQNAPHDLYLNRDFLSLPARAHIFEDCMTRIRNDEASQLLTEVHERHHSTMCIGVDWLTFSLSDLQCIAAGLGARALELMCRTLISDYTLWCHGFPDLLLWTEGEGGGDMYENEDGEKKERRRKGGPRVRLVEVKGPGDNLSNSQIAWIDKLVSVGVRVEVARVSNKK